MRELKYAILGLLNQKSMSGYELSAEFESALNEFWSANHSQIYPELKKLTQEGMITYEVAISGHVLQKKNLYDHRCRTGRLSEMAVQGSAHVFHAERRLPAPRLLFRRADAGTPQKDVRKSSHTASLPSELSQAADAEI